MSVMLFDWFITRTQTLGLSLAVGSTPEVTPEPTPESTLGAVHAFSKFDSYYSTLRNIYPATSLR